MKKGVLATFSYLLIMAGLLVTGDYLWAKVKFLDTAFAKELCNQWNNSKLPDKLGSSGNGWVNTGGKSKQVMQVFARNCNNPKVQLIIEDQGGKAKCTGSGPASGTPDWQFGPKTAEWKKWAKRWSAMNMPALMSTFKGDIGVAKKNLKNFGLFWKAAAKTVEATGSDYSCD